MSTKNKIQKYKFTFSIEENTKPLLGHKTGYKSQKKYFKKIQVTYKKSTVSSHMKSEDEGQAKKMKRRKNFQEVALSLTEPGHKVGGSQSSILSTIEKSKLTREYGAAFPGIKSQNIQDVVLPGVLPRNVPIKEVGFEEAREAMKVNAEILALKGKLDTEPTILLSAIATPAQFFLASAAATKYKRVPKGSSGATVNLRLGKKFTFTNRIDSWEKCIQEALKIDSSGDMKAALTAYTKINRQVTRDMINDFEKMTYDQKKLMNNVMNNLDRRCLVIKASLSTARPTSIASSTFSAGTMSTQLVTSANSAAAPQAPTTADISFVELRECLKHMQTIKLLASSRKISVTLVYGERRRRKCHRFEEKGKSNKVNYPKEKREFLQIMGLPERMISQDGLDYNLKPEIDLQGLKIDYSPPPSRSNGDKGIAENMKNDLKIMETMIDAVEKLTVCEEGSPSIAKNANSGMNVFKNTAVSPYPSRDRSSGNDSSNKNSNGRKRLKKKILKRKKSPPPPDREDLRSMLSCESCSSSDCFESESEVSEDEYSVKDEYVHSANLQPEPFYGLDLTYVTFEMEKIGLVASKKLVSPFLRFTVRDIEGKLAEGTMVQETDVWDVINKNYLRAPGPIHLPLALEALPTDFGVFMELMYYRREHDCIATHCYAYLEREHLRTGEFLCELYRSPVDYSREKIRPYSDKAFFLHFTLAVNKG